MAVDDAGMSYVYAVMLANAVGGLAGFVFFGWFASGHHVEARNLSTIIEIERARNFGGSEASA